MKTLCISLLLLLVVVFYCDAMPQQLGRSRCCQGFKSEPIPIKKIDSITKTHILCLKRGFIVKTHQGKLICYNQTFEWAQNLYNQFHKPKGSKQKN